jgi:hypothetical protein
VYQGADVTVEASLSHIRSFGKSPLRHEIEREGEDDGTVNRRRTSLWDAAKHESEIRMTPLEYALRIGASRCARDILRMNAEQCCRPFANGTDSRTVLLKLVPCSSVGDDAEYDADVHEVREILQGLSTRL